MRHITKFDLALGYLVFICMKRYLDYEIINNANNGNLPVKQRIYELALRSFVEKYFEQDPDDFVQTAKLEFAERTGRDISELTHSATFFIIYKAGFIFEENLEFLPQAAFTN